MPNSKLSIEEVIELLDSSDQKVIDDCAKLLNEEAAKLEKKSLG